MNEKTYLIQGQSGGCIKIGKTRQAVQERIKGNQTGNPDTLVLLGITDIPEALVHAAFAASRVRGEWFADSDELRTWANGNCELTTEGKRWSRGKLRVQTKREVRKEDFVDWYGGEKIGQGDYELLEIFSSLEFNEDPDNCFGSEDSCEECLYCIGSNIPWVIEESKAVRNIGYDYESETLLLEFDVFTSRKKERDFWAIVFGVQEIGLETIARIWVARGHMQDYRVSLPSFTAASIDKTIRQSRFNFGVKVIGR